MTDFSALDGENLMQALQEYCIAEGISDLHMSPEKENVRIEIRRNGVLEELVRIEPVKYENLVRHIKFLSKLKLNVVDVPQDGQYTFSAEGREVNVRVASIPSRFGETYTLRFLDPSRGIVPLSDLGFPSDIAQALADIIQLPNGMFIITGPTGSGKTTTLYALLSTIIGKERNIITLENPIEYELPGIVQSQMDPEGDYTFADGLRSALRHDPDVVLIGEIRDYETAQTAIDASLTGHLVLATLHTNNAPEAITRLLAMGVSPYTFGPALRAILAQRLVRTVKEDLRGTEVDPSDSHNFDGRKALPELLMVSPTIRQLIEEGASVQEIAQKATDEGFKTMREWGAEFVEKGITVQGEVDRVTL